MASAHDFSAKNIQGQDVSFAQFKGKYLLVVNVASKCGFTPQYEGLEKMYEELKSNVEILGFPCNQFGAQEPGDENEIKNFCSLTYNVTFPMFAKVDVNGDKAHPFYKFLKGEQPGFLGTEGIKWNFTKFLVDPQGQVIKRYAPTDTPEKIKSDLTAMLKK